MPVLEPKDELNSRLKLPCENNCKSKLIKPYDFAASEETIQLIVDTEYTSKQSMIVDCIGIHSPQLLKNYCVVYNYEELNNDFNPITTFINSIGNNAQIVDDEILSDMLTDLGYLEADLIDECKTAKNIKKDFELAKAERYFDDYLKKYNISEDYLVLKREHKQSSLILQPKKLTTELIFFFAHADLFKIWGKDHQSWLLNSKLAQYRTLRFMTPQNLYAHIDGILYEINVVLRDAMFRFPPRNKSLDGQSKTFGLTTSKIDLDGLKPQLGLADEVNIKENMTLIRQTFPELFTKYNAVDIFTTQELDKIQREFLSIIRSDFNLEDVEIADTTGSNVARFIKDIIIKHFKAEEKEDKKLLNSIFKLTKVENLQDIPLNDFGIRPYLTVGGLLFSRTAKHPYLKGRFGDLDQVSCYATAMSNLNVYLGEPVTLTFKYEKYKPTLREIINFIENKKPPKDGWFIRVSGKLDKAFNTLIMSDLKFNAKAEKTATKYDISKSRKSIENFNAEKTAKKQAVSTILLKEIKFGYINHDVLEALNRLPEEWYEEYLDLKCDCLVYIPSELIADSLEEYIKLQENLPSEQSKENFNPKEGIKEISGHYHKGNVCLRFFIGDYWQALASKRSKFKKAKNPVQEVYKLFSNSGYGVLACLFLATNNLVASNNITSRARVGAWMMINATNGMSVITDGCGLNNDTMPLGLKFKEILKSNPEYLFNYDESITSGLLDETVNQKWIDDNFKQHLAEFYQLEITHPLVNLFNYELKTEKFTDKSGQEIETTLFTKYYNTNAGNYVKGLSEGSLLIEETEYDFNSQESHIKARSFRGDNQDLLNWYTSSLQKYESPLIYSETEVIKFGDGNQLAIKFLEEGINEVCHPMGFSKQNYKMMKLISRSQFLFLNESQLRNFETNENNLAELSKHIFNRQFWQGLKQSDIDPYNAILRENIDYYQYARTHTVGIGFELLALTKKYKGSIKAVRELIYEKILEGCTDFNAKLNINRSFANAESFKYLLASVIILKKNAEEDLKALLVESVKEPTLLTVKSENIKTLKQLWEEVEED